MTLDRGAGGYWRTYQAQQLATPESFEANPSLVWEFYSYRREVMHTKVQAHTQKLPNGDTTPRPRLVFVHYSRTVLDKVLRYSRECCPCFSNCGGGHLRLHLYLMISG